MTILLSLLTVFASLIYLPSFLDGAVLTPAWFTDDPLLNPPSCTSMDKPCDILVRVRSVSVGGATMNEYRSSQSLCSCPGVQACPSGWDSDPDRSITRHLITRGNSIKLQMKFCDAIQMERECEPNENAMTLRGGGVMPLQVASVTCRCPVGTPLHLKKAWNEGWRLYQSFQCQQDECGINLINPPPCMHSSRINTSRGPTTTTLYPCRCAPNFMCSVDPSRIAHNDHVTGHCERILV